MKKALKVRNAIAIYYALSELQSHLRLVQGPTRLACSALALATIFRAFGALQTEFRLLRQKPFKSGALSIKRV